MDKGLESIVKAVKNIKLTENEKVIMRTYLLEKVSPLQDLEYKDVTKSNPGRLYYYYKNIKNNYFMIKKNRFVPAFAVILIIVIMGSTSAFAEKALPGDLLYGVKISVNEKVAGAFALTKEEKTEWKERLIERRLNEAHKLAFGGNLDETKRINLENDIKSQIDEFNVSVNDLALEKGKSEKSSNLNIRLQASMRAYQSVLGSILGETSIDADTKKETEKFIATLKESRNRTEDSNKNLELGLGISEQNYTKTPTTSEQVQTKQSVALSILNSTKLSYQKEKVNLSTNIQTQIDSKFALAETSLQEGNVLVTSGDYVNANEKFQIVINGVNSIKLLMLSNVIRGDIEDDSDIDDDDIDIGEDESRPSIESELEIEFED